MKTVEIGEDGDISVTGATLVSAPSVVEMIVTGTQPDISGFTKEQRDAFIFKSPTEAKAAEVTLEGIIEAPRINEIVQTVAVRTISIPQIVVLSKKQVTFTSRTSIWTICRPSI